MTQPGLLGLVFGLRRRITGISWLPRSGLLRLPLERRIGIFARGGGKFALPQTLYLAAITREYLRRYSVTPLCNVRESTACSRLRATARPRLFRVLKRLKACKGSPERECTHRFRFRPAHPPAALEKETLLWHATCRAKRWFRRRCDYDLRHDQTMSNLRAAIDQAKTDRYSP